MAGRRSRSAEKAAYWRSHLKRQASSGESIRGYCFRRGLSEALFHFWRREIASRDREAGCSSGPVSAGLVAVEIVGEASPASTAEPAMEIACPGGAVIRLREDVSADVLERVMRACQQAQSGSVGVSGSVRSC